MNILLTNDDGIHAHGLRCLAEAASLFGDVTIVAPDQERSAISHAITLHESLRIKTKQPNWYSVSGTPTDCTYIGLHHLFSKNYPDLLLSGINHGANLGIDVLYSGTVAAAMEGARYGIPSVAFSLATHTPTPEDWAHAKRAVEDFLHWHSKHTEMPPGRVLNVNIPQAPFDSPTPFQWTRLGTVTYPPQVDQRTDPKGRPYFWIGGLPPVYGAQPDSDCAIIQQKIVSVTPLHLDLTDNTLLDSLQNS